jgi:pyruvate/2-oxoglutarate dehydrogenase complex dihydrolipoamide acyltransferase (E2) component
MHGVEIESPPVYVTRRDGGTLWTHWTLRVIVVTITETLPEVAKNRLVTTTTITIGTHLDVATPSTALIAVVATPPDTATPLVIVIRQDGATTTTPAPPTPTATAKTATTTTTPSPSYPPAPPINTAPAAMTMIQRRWCHLDQPKAPAARKMRRRKNLAGFWVKSSRPPNPTWHPTCPSPRAHGLPKTAMKMSVKDGRGGKSGIGIKTLTRTMIGGRRSASRRVKKEVSGGRKGSRKMRSLF